MTIPSGYRVVKMVLEFCLSLPVTGEVDFLFLDQCVGLLVTFATGWLVMHRGKALQEAFAYVQKQKTIEVLRFVSDLEKFVILLKFCKFGYLPNIREMVLKPLNSSHR